MTTITALPTPPTRQDPINFADRADAFLAALPTFATETNAVASEINTKHNDVMSAEIIENTVRGQWTTATSYSLKDIYTDNGVAYIVVVAHTSTTISNDASNGKVKIYQGVLFNDLSVLSGASLVGYQPSGTGYDTTRTVEDKLLENPTIADYLAVTGDDAYRLQALLDANDDVVVVSGDWVINSMVTVPRSNMSIIVRGKLKIGVTRWLLLDGKSNVKIKALGGQIEFAASVTNNNGSSIGAGIHFRNGSNNNVVTGFEVTTLNADRTLTAFVTGTASSCDNHIYKNKLTDIGRPFNIGWTDDAAELDFGNIPTSNWNVSNNTLVTCGRPAYANIMVRSLNNSYDRADPYALTEHTIRNNTFRGMGGTGTTQIFIEYDSNGGQIIGNKIHGNAVDTYCHIAISNVKACDTIIQDNRIQGAFNYQGIELATCFGVKVLGNTIYGLTNVNANCAAVGVSIGGANPASEDCLIEGNHFFDCKVGVLPSGISTAVPYAIRTKINGNYFIRTTSIGIYDFGADTEISSNTFTGATPVIVFCGNSYITSNKFSTTSSFAVSSESGSGVLNIKNNTFNGWGVTGQNGAVFLWTLFTATITGNTFSSDGRSQAGWAWPMTALVKRSTAGPVDIMHYVDANNYGDVQMQMATTVGSYGLINTAIGRIYRSDNVVSGIANKIQLNSAAPSTGTWAAGDRALNIVTTVGQPKGWRCTVSGSPGTWVSEGNL